MTNFVDFLFGAALYLYPARFRERFRDSMLETLAARYGERRRESRAAAVVFVARTLVNLFTTGLREHIEDRRSRVAPPRRKSGMGTWLGVSLKEARFAIRSLRKRPSFALTAIATLALGIGANTAIVSVVKAVLLDRLPYAEPEKLVTVFVGSYGNLSTLSQPDLFDIESGVKSIERLVGYSVTNRTLTELGEPEVLEIARVTAGILETFRAVPVLGRDLARSELGPEGPAVVLVGYGFWRSRLGAREDVIGETLTLNGSPYEIVGVAPDGFGYPNGIELWIPLRNRPEDCGRGCYFLRGVGRLGEGSSVVSAQAELDRLASNLKAAYPDTNTRTTFYLRSLQDQIVGEARPGLLLLLSAVGLLTLLACANVSSLLLVRASARAGEMAVRTAIGASRGRLVAQTLIESFLLAAAGGTLGLALAAASLDLLVRLAPALPRIEKVDIDVGVLSFTLGTLLVVTLLVGVAPAFLTLRAPARSGLVSAGAPPRQRFRSVLLTLETALAGLLLVGAGLLLKSFTALYEVDPGFDSKNIFRLTVLLPEARYDSLEKVRRFYRELEERVRAIPGVDSAGSVWGPPLGRGHASGEVLVAGRPKAPRGEEHDAWIHSIGPGYVETMGIAVVRGRGLTVADDFGSEPVAVVSEAFVRENFPAEDPLGREVTITVDLGYGSPAWRIVGVVRDLREYGLMEDPAPGIYVPHGHYGPEHMTVAIRSRSRVAIFPAVREILREMDSVVAIHRVETMAEVFDREIAPMRFHLALFAAFAGLAVALAAVGIYGVVAYAASSRTREIGLRLALGAERGSVTRLVLAQGLKPAALGVAIGLLAAYLGGHVMEAVLFGVDPRDASVFAVAPVLLLAVALLATVVPARRAGRIDPVRAIRFE